jgi:hypothetical protein
MSLLLRCLIVTLTWQQQQAEEQTVRRGLVACRVEPQQRREPPAALSVCKMLRSVQQQRQQQHKGKTKGDSRLCTTMRLLLGCLNG